MSNLRIVDIDPDDVRDALGAARDLVALLELIDDRNAAGILPTTLRHSWAVEVRDTADTVRAFGLTVLA